MLKRSELRKALNVAADLFRKWIKGGVLPEPVWIEGTPRWSLDEVRAWLAKLPRRAVKDGEAA